MSAGQTVIDILTWQPEVGKSGSWQNIAAKVGFEVATTAALMMIPGGQIAGIAKLGRLGTMGLKGAKAGKWLMKLGKLRTAQKSLSLVSKASYLSDIMELIPQSQESLGTLSQEGGSYVGKKGLIKAGKAAKRGLGGFVKGAVGKLAAGKKVKKVAGGRGGGLMAGVAGLAGDLMGLGMSPAAAMQVAGGKKRRTRGMYLRKGRLFMGFSQKEVKNAMRRSYGGRSRSRGK